jgi:hypothetical protein
MMEPINWQEETFELICGYFKGLGIKYQRSGSIQSDLIAYFNVRSKLIDKRPRRVFKSETLLARELSDGASEALRLIERNIISGQDLTPHQSRDVLNANKHDLLFNDWRIHHFHLKATKKKQDDYFYGRTDELLFAAFSDNQAFLIDVGTHDRADFAKKELLGIMLDNWPSLLTGFIKEDYDPVFFSDYSDFQIQLFREKGLSPPLVKVRDIVLMNPGFGRVMTGANMFVVNAANLVCGFVSQSADQFNRNIDEIAEEISSQYCVKETELNVRVVREELYPYFRLREQRSGYYIDATFS